MTSDGGLGSSLVGERIVVGQHQWMVTKLLGEGKYRIDRSYMPFSLSRPCPSSRHDPCIFSLVLNVFVAAVVVVVLQRWILLRVLSERADRWIQPAVDDDDDDHKWIVVAPRRRRRGGCRQ